MAEGRSRNWRPRGDVETTAARRMMCGSFEALSTPMSIETTTRRTSWPRFRSAAPLGSFGDVTTARDPLLSCLPMFHRCYCCYLMKMASLEVILRSAVVGLSMARVFHFAADFQRSFLIDINVLMLPMKKTLI